MITKKIGRREALKSITGVTFGFMTGGKFTKISDPEVVNKWRKYCAEKYPGVLEGKVSLSAKFLDGMIKFIFDEIRK